MIVEQWTTSDAAERTDVAVAIVVDVINCETVRSEMWIMEERQRQLPATAWLTCLMKMLKESQVKISR